MAKELKEREEAVEHKWIEDLETKEKEKEREKEDEVNELALQAAGAPSVSDRDAEQDLVDPKMATMAELKRRHKITKGKKKAEPTESQKQNFWSASVVESEEEDRVASAAPLTPKHLKMEPAPQASDKVFTGNSMWNRQSSILFADLG